MKNYYLILAAILLLNPGLVMSGSEEKISTTQSTNWFTRKKALCVAAVIIAFMIIKRRGPKITTYQSPHPEANPQLKKEIEDGFKKLDEEHEAHRQQTEQQRSAIESQFDEGIKAINREAQENLQKINTDTQKILDYEVKFLENLAAESKSRDYGAANQ
jgi:outer membrane protein OmpA-like peptidoglycan-associated protein